MDTTLVMIALAFAPARPNLVRNSVIAPPAPVEVVAMARPEETEPQKFTTCHESRSGSCWSE